MWLHGRQRMMTRPLVALLTGVILLNLTGMGRADDEDDRRRENREQVIKGVLELLLEKEMKKRRPQNPPQPNPPFNPNTPPVPLPNPFPNPNQPPGPIRIDQRELQAVADGFASEITTLTQLLTQQIERFPQLRSVLADALKVRAQAMAFQQNVRRGRPQFLQRDVQELDQSWRLVSYRLGEIPGLSRAFSNSIRTLDQFDRQLCQIFGIEPQINREALSQQAIQMVAYWQSLLDDLRFEIPNPRDRQPLQINGQRIQQRVRTFQQSAANGAGHKALVQEYEQISKDWSQYAQNLRQFQKQYLERSISRIDQSDLAIRELLWMSRGIDKRQLTHLVGGLKRSTQELYSHITLDLLLKLPNYQAVPAAADQLQGLCDHMLDCLQRDEPIEELIDAYSYLPSAWVSFSRPFGSLPSPHIQQELQQIELQMSSLQQALGVQPQFNHEQAGRYAVTLEDRTEHLEEDLNSLFRRSRETLPRELVATLQQQAASVKANSRRVYELCVNRAPVEQIRQESTKLFQQWLSLSQQLDKVQVVRDDEHLNELTAQISATLVELETLLAF